MVEKAERCQDGMLVELTIGHQPVISESYRHVIHTGGIGYESRVDSEKSELVPTMTARLN